MWLFAPKPDLSFQINRGGSILCQQGGLKGVRGLIPAWAGDDADAVDDADEHAND